MQASLGRAIKTHLGIPSPLWCSAVILEDKMRSTHHNYFGAGESMGLRMRQKGGGHFEVGIKAIFCDNAVEKRTSLAIFWLLYSSWTTLYCIE